MRKAKESQVVGRSRFFINRKGAHAVMELREGKFVVIQGSTALKDTYSGMTSYVKLKENLIASGALVHDENLLRFSTDVVFDSISAAANVVLDRNSNGNKEWRHEQSKRSFGEWLKGEANMSKEQIV